MKPNKNHYNESIRALFTFAQKFPQFDSRSTFDNGSRESHIANAISTLDYTAGTWACSEKTHYTTAQYQAALNLIINEIGDYQYVQPVAAARANINNAARRADRYATDPEFRARCDSFGTKPRGA